MHCEQVRSCVRTLVLLQINLPPCVQNVKSPVLLLPLKTVYTRCFFLNESSSVIYCLRSTDVKNHLYIFVWKPTADDQRNLCRTANPPFVLHCISFLYFRPLFSPVFEGTSRSKRWQRWWTLWSMEEGISCSLTRLFVDFAQGFTDLLIWRNVEVKVPFVGSPHSLFSLSFSSVFCKERSQNVSKPLSSLRKTATQCLKTMHKAKWPNQLSFSF